MFTGTTLPGVFSVQEYDKDTGTYTYIKELSFSKGNLQYNKDQKLYRFAINQYDFVGGEYDGVEYGNVYESGDKSKNEEVDKTDYKGWIDLFGWGTGFEPTRKSNEWQEYPYYDEWGYNKIDGEFKNWKTPSVYDWDYLLNIRTGITYGTINVDGNPDHDVRGYFLTPDDWVCPSGIVLLYLYGTIEIGHIYKIKTFDEWRRNYFTLSEWDMLENSGVVFLPVTGYRKSPTAEYISVKEDDSGNTINNDDLEVYWDGYPYFRAQYWSSTESPLEQSTAYYALLQQDKIFIHDYSRFHGYAVRLVRDINDTAITIDTALLDLSGNPLTVYYTEYMNRELITGTTWYTADKEYAESGTTETAIPFYIVTHSPYYIDLDAKIWEQEIEPIKNCPFKRYQWVGYEGMSIGGGYYNYNSLTKAILTLGSDVVYNTPIGWTWIENCPYLDPECSGVSSYEYEIYIFYRGYQWSSSDKTFKHMLYGNDCGEAFDPINDGGKYDFSSETNLLKLTYSIFYEEENKWVDEIEKYKVVFEEDTSLPESDRHPNDLMWFYEYPTSSSYSQAFYKLCHALSLTPSEITKDMEYDESINSLWYLLTTNKTLINAFKKTGYDSIIGYKDGHYSVFIFDNNRAIEKE